MKTRRHKAVHRRRTSKLCVACESVNIDKIVKTNKFIVSSWLKDTDYIANFIKNTPVKKHVQKHTNINVKVDLGKINANKYILYFAALPSNFKTIRPSKLAYGNFKNKGVTKLNKHGKAILKIKCPQCYSDDDGKNKKAETFYRHVHFCLANKDNTQWNPTLYTKIVICDLSYFKMKSLHSNGNVVLINALPCEYYAKDHIVNSYNLPLDKINKMSQHDLMLWMKEVIQQHYPKLHNKIINKTLYPYEVPIVVYCAHNKCSASNDVAKALLQKRFVNVSEYSGGMKEYNYMKASTRD